MRQYGAMKATEFTKKQIGVIYSMNKQGILTVEADKMNEFYKLADYYGYDDNRSVERAEQNILRILEAVFTKDIEKAQKLINAYEV
jgi:hypothetical protein